MNRFIKGLLILVKYRILMWSNIPKRRGRRERPAWFFIVIYAAIALSFGIPGYFLLKDLFVSYSQVSLGNLTLADLFLEISLLGVLTLVLLLDTPAIILSVFMSEDVEYLLSLPLPQSSIFYFKMLETLIEGTIPALFFIPVLLAYSKVSHMSWYAVLCAFLLYFFYVLFCAGIAGFISLVMSKMVSKSGTKRFMFFSSLITLAAAYLMIQVTSMPTLKAQNVERVLNAYAQKINSYLWPSTWFLKGLKGEILYSLLLVGVALLVFWISFIVAKRWLLSGFSNVKSSSSKKKVKRYKVKGVFSALISKELKLLKREPSVLFMVLYPAIFPIIFVLPSGGTQKTFITGEAAGVFMASTYLIISMASLVSIDVKAEWILKSLPVKRSSMLWAKVLTVSGIYMGVLTLTFSGISAFLGGIWYAIITLILAIPMFLSSSFFGAYAVTKWPNPSGGVRKPLNISGSLVSMMVGFLAAACVTVESLYIYFKFFKGNFKIFSWQNRTVDLLLFLILPAFLELVFITFTFKKVKKMDWGDPFENRNAK